MHAIHDLAAVDEDKHVLAQGTLFILDEQGALRKHMLIFIDGGQIVDRVHLSDPVKENDVDICRPFATLTPQCNEKQMASCRNCPSPTTCSDTYDATPLQLVGPTCVRCWPRTLPEIQRRGLTSWTNKVPCASTCLSSSTAAKSW